MVQDVLDDDVCYVPRMARERQFGSYLHLDRWKLVDIDLDTRDGLY